MNLRFVDWIWHVRGSLALEPGQSIDDAFARLDGLFRQTGTSHERTGDMLTFRKKDQAAQDKMSVFDEGILQIEKGVAGPVMRYRLSSRILLLCFLAPLFFLAIGQLTIFIGKLDAPSAEAAKAAEAKKKAAAKKVDVPLNPIDKFLGAPEPEKKKPRKKDDEDDKKKASPTAAYVFAAIFATLYVVGRILEDRLVKSLFKKRLIGS